MPKDEGIDEEKAAYSADEYGQVGGNLIHIVILSLLIQRHELNLFRNPISGPYVDSITESMGPMTSFVHH